MNHYNDENDDNINLYPPAIIKYNIKQEEYDNEEHLIIEYMYVFIILYCMFGYNR